ncbi:MAG: hypothetical protein ACRBI6_04615 [Acidimicrobiales bacterium]
MKHATAWPKNYRNRYVADEGCNGWSTLEEAEALGLMARNKVDMVPGFMFCVTELGFEVLRSAEPEDKPGVWCWIGAHEEEQVPTVFGPYESRSEAAYVARQHVDDGEELIEEYQDGFPLKFFTPYRLPDDNGGESP